MNIGLYQSAASLSALERWQDAVTQNITSSQVTGFKKRTVNFSTVSAGEVITDPRAKAGDGTGQPSLFPRAAYGINFSLGETQPTRRDLDVALQSDGFFEVQLEDGRRGYTRAGELRLRPDRTLVTAQDVPILSDGGTPIQLLPEGGSVVINRDGSVFQGATAIGRISVVTFADNRQLRPLSAGVFTNMGAAPQQVDRPEILQGYLEASNITPLREMVDLVNIARAYEANQRMIQNRDQTLAKTIETLG
ncbi:MAG TPA: flagellar hook-basal body protein [Opitutaceae bacterium]|nr:flagellar hook-basal body protein [Opitutaceae bacterium]